MGGMATYKCINRERDGNGRIISYDLISPNRKKVTVAANDLKSAMKSGAISVMNLRMTADGRIYPYITQDTITAQKEHQGPNRKPSPANVSKQPVNSQEIYYTKEIVQEQLKKFKNKLAMIGLELPDFTYTIIKGKVFITGREDYNIRMDGKTIVIPPFVYGFLYKTNPKEVLHEFTGALAIKGISKVVMKQPAHGKLECLFCQIETDSLDLTDFNMSEVTSIEGMFTSAVIGDLNLSGVNTSKVENMEQMFAYGKINRININGIDTSKVKNMEETFYDLQTNDLDLSGLDTSSVTNMKKTFAHMIANKINLSNFNTSNVKSMHKMFEATRLTNLDVSSFDTSKVEDMERMFAMAGSKELNLTSFRTPNLRNTKCMFEMFHTDKLDITGLDTHNVTDMSYMFHRFVCNNVKGIETLRTPKVRSMMSMFSSAVMTGVHLRKFDTSNVTDMTYMFSGSNIKIIDLGNFDVTHAQKMNNMFCFCTTSILNISSFKANKQNRNEMFLHLEAQEVYVRDKKLASEIEIELEYNGVTKKLINSDYNP